MRKFKFPRNNKKVSINFKTLEDYAGKVRQLAEIYGCAISDILETFVTESIIEYEEKYGQIDIKKAAVNFDPRVDRYRAGDKLQQKEFEIQIENANGRQRVCMGKHCKRKDNKYRENEESQEITIGKETYRFCSMECQKSMFNFEAK